MGLVLGWVLLLRAAVESESGSTSGSVLVAWITVGVWAVVGGGVLLGAQWIVMELILPELSDAVAAEQVRAAC